VRIFHQICFFRYDATVQRLEAVRGGTSAISSNAPGGIFNYTSKEGGLNNEIRVKYGLEGNGANPYYRADLVLGENLKKMVGAIMSGAFIAMPQVREMQVFHSITGGKSKPI
jgi:hypothetical protein